MRNRFVTGLWLGAGWYFGNLLSRSFANVSARKIAQTQWYNDYFKEYESTHLRNNQESETRNVAEFKIQD